jgi:hypothetical protein
MSSVSPESFVEISCKFLPSIPIVDGLQVSVELGAILDIVVDVSENPQDIL